MGNEMFTVIVMVSDSLVLAALSHNENSNLTSEGSVTNAAIIMGKRQMPRK